MDDSHFFLLECGLVIAGVARLGVGARVPSVCWVCEQVCRVCGAGARCIDFKNRNSCNCTACTRETTLVLVFLKHNQHIAHILHTSPLVTRTYTHTHTHTNSLQTSELNRMQPPATSSWLIWLIWPSYIRSRSHALAPRELLNTNTTDTLHLDTPHKLNTRIPLSSPVSLSLSHLLFLCVFYCCLVAMIHVDRVMRFIYTSSCPHELRATSYSYELRGRSDKLLPRRSRGRRHNKTTVSNKSIQSALRQSSSGP
jgi:hypothetical protein